ncbi:NUDIX hydrolase [Candidatus Uhrbacteria bacterium]|nr:NUDIX hydrolase [Candidatus Uhrbacteria bacterium]
MQNKLVAGGVIVKPDGEVLMIEQNHNSWSFPKGKVENGEDIFMAAIREIHEETGITDLCMLKKLPSFERKSLNKNCDPNDPTYCLNTYYFYLFSTNQKDIKPNDPDNEITNARWVSKEHVAELLTHPCDKDFFTSIIHQI